MERQSIGSGKAVKMSTKIAKIKERQCKGKAYRADMVAGDVELRQLLASLQRPGAYQGPTARYKSLQFQSSFHHPHGLIEDRGSFAHQPGRQRSPRRPAG